VFESYTMKTAWYFAKNAQSRSFFFNNSRFLVPTGGKAFESWSMSNWQTEMLGNFVCIKKWMLIQHPFVSHFQYYFSSDGFSAVGLAGSSFFSDSLSLDERLNDPEEERWSVE